MKYELLDERFQRKSPLVVSSIYAILTPSGFIIFTCKYIFSK